MCISFYFQFQIQLWISFYYASYSSSILNVWVLHRSSVKVIWILSETAMTPLDLMGRFLQKNLLIFNLKWVFSFHFQIILDPAYYWNCRFELFTKMSFSKTSETLLVSLSSVLKLSRPNPLDLRCLRRRQSFEKLGRV